MEKMVTLQDISRLTGESLAATIEAAKTESKFPPHKQVGTHYLFTYSSVLKYLKSKDIKVETPPTVEAVFTPGDRLIGIKEVMAKLGINSRSWFQEGIRRNYLPGPLIQRRPRPSLWRESDIDDWINEPKTLIRFRPYRSTTPEVFFGDRKVGQLERVQKPYRTQNEAKTRYVYGWMPIGCEYEGKPFSKRIDAAKWLISREGIH